MKILNTLFEHTYVAVISCWYRISQLFKGNDKVTAWFRNIYDTCEECRVFITGRNRPYCLSNMHAETVSDMLYINLYCIQSNLLDYFKKSMANIAREILSLRLFFPTVKQWKEAKKVPEEEADSSTVLALPLKYYPYSSSDDTIMLMTKKTIDKVLKRFVVLCKNLKLELQPFLEEIARQKTLVG